MAQVLTFPQERISRRFDPFHHGFSVGVYMQYYLMQHPRTSQEICDTVLGFFMDNILTGDEAETVLNHIGIKHQWGTEPEPEGAA